MALSHPLKKDYQLLPLSISPLCVLVLTHSCIFQLLEKQGVTCLSFLCVLVLTHSCIFQLLEKQGATCSLEELGDQTLPDGSKIELPPVLLGQLGTDPKKKTLLVYGHLDVQPAFKVSLVCCCGPNGRYRPH